MRKCDKSDPKQLWKCEKSNQENYIKLVQSGKYLHHGDLGTHYVTAKPDDRSLTWARYGSKQDLCSKGNLNFTNKNKTTTACIYTLYDSPAGIGRRYNVEIW